MVDKRFQIVESNFERLRQKFIGGQLSREQFAESLRKLRLFDDHGRCWMLGAQSGQWYFYDGKKWVKAEPPADTRETRSCPVCGSENEIEAEVCSRCQSALTEGRTKLACPECGRLLAEGQSVCPACGAAVRTDDNQNQVKDQSQEVAGKKRNEETVLWYLSAADPLSFLLFFGGLGIFLGILFGLMAGATGFLPGLKAWLPTALQEMQGKLVGSFVFSFLGGLLGFLILAAGGFVLAFLINASIYFLGGPGFKLQRARRHSRNQPS